MLLPHATLRAAQFAGIAIVLVVSAPSLLAQGTNNINNGVFSAILAGSNNVIGGGNYNFIGSGAVNRVDGTGNNISVIVGGVRNTNYAGRSVIVGGQRNLIGTNSRSSTITGGEFNLIEAINPSAGSVLGATIGGGISNLVGSNAIGAVVGGGRFNESSGPGATVPGGFANEASGTNSFAAGTRARALHDYSFVWGGSPDVDTTSFGSNTFTVRSPGGAKFLTSTNDNFGVQLSANGAGWSSISDSNVKTAVKPLNHRITLQRLAQLPVTQWSYKHDPSRRYIGPMAQDFHAAFGLGVDDKTISTLDTDGVTLSAIKGLVEELREQDAILAARERQIRAIEAEVEALRGQIGL